MSPAADDGALIITFARAWTAAQRLAFMEDVARALSRERWAHLGEGCARTASTRRPPSAEHSSPG